MIGKLQTTIDRPVPLPPFTTDDERQFFRQTVIELLGHAGRCLEFSLPLTAVDQLVSTRPDPDWSKIARFIRWGGWDGLSAVNRYPVVIAKELMTVLPFFVGLFFNGQVLIDTEVRANHYFIRVWWGLSANPIIAERLIALVNTPDVT